MNFLQIFAGVVVLVMMVQSGKGSDTFYIKTSDVKPHYMKGVKDRAITCGTGVKGALKFSILPGLAQGTGKVSFKSGDFNRYYITAYKDSYSYLEPLENTDFFASRGSFMKRNNQFYQGTVAYESVEYPRNFLLCLDGELRVLAPLDDDEMTSASFVTEQATSREDLWTPCSVTCGGGTQSSKDRTCLLGSFFCSEIQTRKCNTQRCQTNPCRRNTCDNGGVCEPKGDSYECKCEHGFSGRHCEHVLYLCSPNPCENGRCKTDGKDYSCRCSRGWTGKKCNIATNPCNSDPCENDGSCRGSGRGFVCDCRAGYTGDRCQTTLNPCQPNPCENRGKCFHSGQEYQCVCTEGYTGSRCQYATNPCNSHTCENGGTCRRSGRGFVCDCRAGYTGDRCQTPTNPCNSHPCQNGGSCSRSEGGFVCDCPAGYTGDRCQTSTNPCISRPCQNGGFCRRSGSRFICDCREGYTGDRCQTSLSQTCDPNPCQNGGACSDTGSGFSCKCAIGYYGNRCQTKLRIGEWSPCSAPCNGGSKYKGEICTDMDVITCNRTYNDCNMHECPAATCKNYRFSVRTHCCAAPTQSTCGVTKAIPQTGRRIIGGVDSKELMWPWMAAIYYKPRRIFYCGGTIVNDRWIVSAGHCIQPYNANQLEVLLGTANRVTRRSGHTWKAVGKKILHPSYDNPLNDIGLLQLKRAVRFTDAIKPICFPNGEKLEVDTTCYAAGWGVAFVTDIPQRKPSDFLKHVGLRTLPLDACVQGYRDTSYERGVNDNIICSGLLGGSKDTCLGDSGGPLVCQRKNSCEWYLAGVTSFGATECAVGNIPGGFMDVEKYEGWIKQHIG